MGKNDFTEYDQLEALKISRTGVWRLEAEENQHIRFYGDALLDELIGMEQGVTPEERFDIFMSRVYPDDMELFMEYNKTLKEKSQAEVVYRYMHPNLGIIYVRCGGKKVLDYTDMDCYRGFHQDVTDTVRIEQETKKLLTSQAELFRSIAYKMMEHTADSIAKIDINDGTFDWVSMDGIEINDQPGYGEIFRMLSENVPEEHRKKFIENSSLINIKSKLAKADHYSFSVFMHRPKDGELCRITYWYYRLDNDDKHVLSIFRDTTQDYEKEQQLEEALLMSNKASRAKTRFLNNMSHDIRTPMNAIIGFTNLAQKYIDDKEKCLDYLDKIKTSSGHLLSLINDVLDMSRIESGRMEFHCEPASLKEIMNGLNTIFRTDAKNKGLHFTVDCSEIQHDLVVCDKLRLNQVLLNCTSNAVKFTDEGGSVRVSAKEIQPAKTSNAYGAYEFVIADNGIGISEKYIHKIFEPFSREENEVHHIQGTGLGMTICKNLVDTMNGTISVKSKQGVGTTFTIQVEFPLADEIEKQDDSDTRVHKVMQEKRRILLAEDNQLNTEIATLLLEDEGFVLEHAEDGVVCLKMLEEAENGYYDLILMDIQMPNMNGYDAARAIRSLADPVKAQIPIIAMTANAFDEDRQKATDAGMNGHVAKPIDVDVLMNTMMEILGE